MIKLNILKKLRLRKTSNNENLTFKQILARENKLSAIPSYVLPICIGFSSFLFFALFENDRAIVFSAFLTLAIPLFSLLMYVKQAKLTDFSPIKSGDYFFKTKGYEEMVIRFEVLAKLLFPCIVLFVISTIFLGFLLYGNSVSKGDTKNFEKIVNLLIIWFFMIPFMMVFTMLIFRVRIRQWNDFEFHYALGCFRIAQNLSDLSEEKRLDYLMKGINHYGYFLQNNLRVRFNKIPQLFSKIITSSENGRLTILEEIVSQMNERSKFTVITCFVKLIPKTDVDSLFTPYSFIDKLRYWAPVIAFAATAIGILSQIIPVFIAKSG